MQAAGREPPVPMAVCRCAQNEGLHFALAARASESPSWLVSSMLRDAFGKSVTLRCSEFRRGNQMPSGSSPGAAPQEPRQRFTSSTRSAIVS
mmetsp:Transcript_116192/g.328749  ORF Transcript_116192/g.328749 Transcript_116192/m.328749 type:complete len:92 (-) Transcript_116192:446-721(-)